MFDRNLKIKKWKLGHGQDSKKDIWKSTAYVMPEALRMDELFKRNHEELEESMAKHLRDVWRFPQLEVGGGRKTNKRNGRWVRHMERK